MSLIIKNVGASNKLLLPNGKPLKLGAEIKVPESILNSSLVRNLISSGKLTVKAAGAKEVALEVVDVVKEVLETVSLAAINPVAAVTNAADLISEVKEAVESISSAIEDEVVLTVASEESTDKPKSRRKPSKKDEE